MFINSVYFMPKSFKFAVSPMLAGISLLYANCMYFSHVRRFYKLKIII